MMSAVNIGRMLVVMAICLAQMSPIALHSRVPKLTGIYSNLHYIDEAGDLLGCEIMIVYAEDDYYAFVQWAESWPIAPFISRVEVSGNRVTFQAPPETNLGCFVGTINKKALEGRFSNISDPLVLPRKKSYWQ